MKKLIFTGGVGKDQRTSDSKVAKIYAINKGVPASDILIEEVSEYTYQNLRESKKIMDSLELKSALLVSDPIHMKRSMTLAHIHNIPCASSPTRTSMYRNTSTKMKFLLYETFYFSIREIKEFFS